MLREMIPQAIRRGVRDSWFLYELGRVRRAVEQRGQDIPTPDELQTLSRAWGNLEWAANVDFLHEVCTRARQTPGPILECGSGLSTVLMGMLTQQRRVPVLALEHEPVWLRRVQAVTRRAGMADVRIHLAPLRSYGSFDWYESPSPPSAPYTLVVCDGPPGATPGGRSGLLPVVATQLAAGCVILLDDAERPGEQETLRRWQEGWSVQVEVVGREHPPARARVTFSP